MTTWEGKLEDLQLRRPNVYVTGAGFSASMANLPTTHNFVSALLEENLPDKEIIYEVVKVCYPEWDVFSTKDEVEKFREDLNIEDMFNMVETLDDARRLILKSNDLSYLQKGEYRIDENYLSRLQCLVARFLWEKSNANRQNAKLIGFAKRLTKKDGIITFNWDLLVEKALDEVGIPWSYLPLRDHLFICKLHGSVNWFHRLLNPIMAVDEPLPIVEVGGNIRIVEEPVGATCWDREGYRAYMDPRMALGFVPKILAFNPRKDISTEPFLKLWIWASECMIKSYRISILGYSLPPADLSARHLFNLSLGWHRRFSGFGTESEVRRSVVNTNEGAIDRISRACVYSCTVFKMDIAEAFATKMNTEVPEWWYQAEHNGIIDY